MPVSIEEYIGTEYEPDCDFVDGELIDRNAGYYPHSGVLSELLYVLHAHRPAIRVYPTLRMRVALNRIRVVDVCAVAGPEPKYEILQEPPFLCIEVLSHLDTLAAMQEKIDDYLGFGVANIWLIDSLDRRAWVYTTDGSREVKDGVLRTEDPAITVPLSEVFARRKA